MARFAKIWPPVAGGLLCVACFPPFRLSFLVFVALVPWLLFLRTCDGKRAFRSGMLFGFVFLLGELSFICQFVSRWVGSEALGVVPYLLGCLVACFYFALFGWLANICYRRSLPWMVPVVWAGVEVFRSYVVQLAFPYGLLAMPLTSTPSIIQTAHYGTVYLTSAWIVIANVAVAEGIRGARWTQLRWYAGVFVALLSISLIRYSTEPGGTLRHVVAGQTGVDLAFGDPELEPRLIQQAVAKINRSASGADLLVLPEGIVRAGDTLPPPINFAVDPHLPVVFGGQRGENPSYQSAFSYDGHWEAADKTRLVIFGEYVPLRHLWPDGFKLPAGDLRPADRVTTLTVGKFRVGASLCFEALFPNVSYQHALNGATILAVMSIDDWYLGSNAPEQLRDFTNWRAIETGLPAVRAASLGYSIVVDARGRTIASAPLYGTHALEATVRVPDKPDLFPFLPIFPYLAAMSLVGIPAYDLWLRRRKSGASGPGR
jgi:apolipoprotein N-acyltransferase